MPRIDGAMVSGSALDSIDALRAWSARARPVFIVGQERSGTSALLLALARHPSLFAVPDVYETFVFRYARELLAEPPRKMQQGYLRGPDHAAALRAALHALAAGDPDGLADDDIVRAFFAFAAENVYGDCRPLEKTPSHVFSLPRLFDVFPQAQVIACVREPVEVVDSYRHRLARERVSGKPREAWGWLEQDIKQLIEHFRRIDRALRASASQFPGRVFQVPYAWLTDRAPEALQSICDFLGEPFDHALLSPKRVNRERGDARLAEPISAAPQARDSLLTPEEVATLTHETWGLTRRWRVPGIIQPEPPAA